MDRPSPDDYPLECLSLSPSLTRKLRDASFTSIGEVRAAYNHHTLEERDGIGREGVRDVENSLSKFDETTRLLAIVTSSNPSQPEGSTRPWYKEPAYIVPAVSALGAAFLIAFFGLVASWGQPIVQRLVNPPVHPSPTVPTSPNLTPNHAESELGKVEQAQNDGKTEAPLKLRYGDPKKVFDSTSSGFTLETSLKIMRPLLKEPETVFQDKVVPFTDKPIAGAWPGTLEELGPRPESPKDARRFVLGLADGLKAECFLKPGRSGIELESLKLGVGTVSLTEGWIAQVYRQSSIDPSDFMPKATGIFHILNCEHKPL